MSSAPAPSDRPPSSASASNLLHLDQQLCFALYATSLAMTKLYKPLLAPMGLTYPQYLVMLVLWERDDRAVHELGELLQLDSGTLTPLLKRLETSGLVSRQRDAADERRVRIRLTPAGQALRAQAESVPTSILCHLGKDGKAIVELRDGLNRVRQQLHTQPRR